MKKGSDPISGRLIVLSGPSGVGKTTVCDALLRHPGFRRVVTATSRPPRRGEQDGVDYHFRSEGEFRAALGRGEFLESATVHGHLYGTPRKEVEEGLRQGHWLLLNIDVQGARQIRESVRQGAALPLSMVFLEPPSMEELERRLRGRATDLPASVAERLRAARREMEEGASYDHRVVNDSVPHAVERILGAIGHGDRDRRS